MPDRPPPSGPWAPGGWRTGVLAVTVAVLVVACGDGGSSSGDGERLEASLGFLTARYQFSSDQVGCVRQQLERRVPAGAVADLDDQLRGIDAGVVAIDDLPTDQAEAVTAAIATCAVAQ